MSIFDPFFRDISIDLGTANSLIYLKGRGIVVNEPTVAAINRKTNQILAVGEDAKRMMSRTPPYIEVIRPLVGGVISDFDMTQELLRQFLKRLNRGAFFSYRRAVIAIPDNLTEVERKSVEDAVLNAGCSQVYLIESPVAAALGANLAIDLPVANLIVDIGGGTTDIAVVSMGATVLSRTLKVAGDRFNEDIIKFVREEFKLLIGEPTAEFAKITAGSAMPVDSRLEIAIRGRDVSSGLPKEIIVKNSHIRYALGKTLRTIVDAVKDIIEETPPELVGDMLERGVYLCGGGALLRGIDQLFEKETLIKARIVEDPLTCAIRGMGLIIDNFEAYRRYLDNPLKPFVINL